MKKPDAARPTSAMKGLDQDARTAAAFPGLVEFMSDGSWDDGSPRETGSLTLFIDGGVWKGCLNDRENEQSMYVTGVTLEAVLKALEKRLAAGGEGEWRPWKNRGKKR